MFVHTSIRVRDMDKSIDFYTSLLGLELQNRRAIPQNEAEIAFLQDHGKKGASLELTHYRKQKKFIQAEYEDRIFDHIAFYVESMSEAISSAKKNKITVTDEPFRLGLSGPLIAFIEDPNGTLIELIERKEKQP